ncbi:MAG: YARHG domain-containing protein, partial [Candidatus Kapaibacteriota bacterium]
PRHGYAFKKRAMRIFFEEQDLYVPISSNPKQGLTPLEKKNLKIIDRYEKNYRMYESFAR